MWEGEEGEKGGRRGEEGEKEGREQRGGGREGREGAEEKGKKAGGGEGRKGEEEEDGGRRGGRKIVYWFTKFYSFLNFSLFSFLSSSPSRTVSSPDQGSATLQRHSVLRSCCQR